MRLIPLTLLGVIAFIMIFSYATIGVLYNDYSFLGETTGFETPKDFGEWLNPQFNIYIQWFEDEYDDKSQQNLINFVTFNKNKWNISFELWMLLYRDRWTIYSKFYENNQGDEYYSYLKESPIWEDNQRAKHIASYYSMYLNEYGLELVEGDITKHKEATKNLWQTVTGFLGKIPEGFSQIIKVLTFDLPHMPAELNLVFKIIFMSLGIIIIIGILPVIIAIVRAIAELIPF